MKKMLNVSSLVLGLTFLFVSVDCLGGTRSEDPTGGDNNLSPEMERRISELDNSIMSKEDEEEWNRRQQEIEDEALRQQEEQQRQDEEFYQWQQENF